MQISRITHDLFFKDKSQSLCSRAFDNKFKGFWKIFKILFGYSHCEVSWKRYNKS